MQPSEHVYLAVQSETPLMIGVDGGATEVKAHAVEAVEGGFAAGKERASFRYEPIEGFVPAPIDEQLAQRNAGDVRVGALERAQGERWVDACAHAIESVAASAKQSRALVGMCMPGSKTRDRRGIDAMRNGPRVPDFVDQLESRIARSGIVLVAPIAELSSDGDACGRGENAARDGNLRDVLNAYYVGGGTGLAECFKLDGRITGLDDLAGKVDKAWAMKSSIRRSYEDHISVRGINARWVELGGDPHAHPESGWASGKIAAIQALSECVVYLDELLRARIATLHRLGLPALERFVIGQRLGSLLASPEMTMLRASAEKSFPIPMRLSTLRAAPAIGAVHLSLESWRGARDAS